MSAIDAPVAQNDVIVSVVDRYFGLRAKPVGRPFKPLFAFSGIEQHRQGLRSKPFIA